MLRIKIIISILGLCLFSSCEYVENKQPVGTPSFDSVISRGERLSDSGYKKEAFNLVVSGHGNAKDLTLQDEMNYFSYTSGLYNNYFKDKDSYIAAADSMIAILDKHPHIAGFSDKYYVWAYNMKADGLFSNGLYTESYEYYYKSKSLAQKNADSCSLSNFTYNLAMVLYKQRKYQEAAWEFQRSLDEARFCPDQFVHFYHKQELLDNIGLSYLGAKRYDSALLFFHKAITYIDSSYLKYAKNENVYITAKAVVYGNMGNTYTAMGLYDTAAGLLRKSIAINLQKGYTNSDALLDQVKLANLYFTTGLMDSMKQVLTLIRSEMDTIPDIGVEASWNKLMWNYYDRLHDSVKAYRYASAYLVKNDSLLARDKVLMATDLAGRVKSLERQNNINLLQKDNEQERRYLIIAIIVSIMALIFVVQLMRSAKKTRKNLRKLTDLNDTVNEQNERLALALDGLEQKDKDKSRILRSVAHDVMNPISAIMALADILLSESEDFTTEHKEMLELIREACGNSLSLSKDILEASTRLDPSTIEKEWVDINELIESSVKLLGVKAAEKRQKIIFTAGSPLIKAYVNKKKMWRVINNLIGNAIKFSYENTNIDVDITTKEEKVYIDVIDRGIGIPPKNKEHVFDMFTEAKSAGTSGEKPNGLGLSISLSIARAHKGDIWFDSEEGKGTVFHLEFPIDPAKY